MLPSSEWSASEHDSFLRYGAGRGRALLLHGFPGTPAEMRPLARILHQRGWTVSGPLLPGFGADEGRIGQLHYRQWAEAVAEARREIEAEDQPLLLVGYSIGATLAVIEAQRSAPSALVLFAPFSRLSYPVQGLLATVMRTLLPGQSQQVGRPGRAEPWLRRRLAGSLPHLDPNAPETLAFLRSLSLPTAVLHQLQLAGRAALRAASAVEVPVLCFQGTDDPISPPRRTRLLLSRFKAPCELEELPGDHELLAPGAKTWPRIVERLEAFLDRHSW
ncbi:MAG TPA: alpha/beta fold hydrolase [Thermoanaerobaculia bacterium]|nr:alpha/beta fold hydrolase [Thermoanaerobaculia bacterium]